MSNNNNHIKELKIRLVEYILESSEKLDYAYQLDEAEIDILEALKLEINKQNAWLKLKGIIIAADGDSKVILEAVKEYIKIKCND